MGTKIAKGSPTTKAPKKAIAKTDVKAKSPKVEKPKRELIPMNEDPTSWTVNLSVQTAKDGRVKFPITGSGRIPLLNGGKVDNGHGKKQAHLDFVIDGFTPVKGGEDDYNIRINRATDLRAEQKNALSAGLKKRMRDRIREVNNAVAEKGKAEQAAIRKAEHEAKAKQSKVKEVKAVSPKAKSPIKSSPKS